MEDLLVDTRPLLHIMQADPIYRVSTLTSLGSGADESLEGGKRANFLVAHYLQDLRSG